MDPKRKTALSQFQIAKEVGCSQSLVSRVLNGRNAGLPEETIRRIWNCARDRGYRPRGIDLDQLIAETVATRMVGVILRSPLRLVDEGQVFLHAHQGMHEFLLKRNVRTVYLGSEDELNAGELVRMLEQQKLVEGLAVMGEVQPNFIRTLATCQKPVVIVSARYPGICHSVVSSLPQAAELLVDHLVSLGHQRIAWIGSKHGLGRLLHHREAVLRAMSARRLPIPLARQIEMPEADRENGHFAAKELFDRDCVRKPTAIICHNAMMARGALNHLIQRGLSVPRDVSVVAFDMTKVCVEEPPHITSAAALPESLGEEAARLILFRSCGNDNSVCELTLPSRLVIRQTTAAAR